MTMRRTDKLIETINELMDENSQDAPSSEKDERIRECLLECARHIAILER